jgi:acyl-CoA-binding protein
MQSKLGDCTIERPMWAEHGGIDFHGRACWDAWTELKV